MIKDILINLFGTYTPAFTPINLTVNSSDGASEIILALQQAFIDFVWLGKFCVFIVGLFLLFKLLLAVIAMVKR